MFLLGQLRPAELLDADLLSDLLAKLAAFAEELLVLLLDRLQLRSFQAGSRRLVDSLGLEQIRLAPRGLDDGRDPGEGLEVGPALGEDVDRLLDGQCPDAPEFPPHADAVPGGLGRQAVHEDDPTHGPRV